MTSSGERVELAHGAGGRVMADLIDRTFKRAFANDLLARGEDQAVFTPPPGRLAMTTDGFVVSPLFFPGGDIGSLAVYGTVNDLAVGGARPLHVSAGFILEEGFPLADLERLVASMAAAANEAGVGIVTGDTKVVERGKGDGVFITTTGLGVVPDVVRLGIERIEPGDAVVVSGTLGDHGVAIMSKRSGLAFTTEIRSDSAPLHGLVAAMLDAAPNIRCMRDPTRGGLAATLNEITAQRRLGVVLEENGMPIRPEVRGACELLGLDPLYVANEGKLVAFCPDDDADRLVQVMRAHPQGVDAARIGTVSDDPAGLVELVTSFGGRRVVDWLAGEQLPRIC
ncbi:MAG: hydrogenase expression/formation protein HypE [Pseudomonadota bacterium]